jgi:hypothetical protein
MIEMGGGGSGGRRGGRRRRVGCGGGTDAEEQVWRERGCVNPIDWQLNIILSLRGGSTELDPNFAILSLPFPVFVQAAASTTVCDLSSYLTLPNMVQQN